MVVKMRKWSPWQQQQPTWAFKKFQVKVRPINVEGFDCLNNAHDEKEMVVLVRMKWRGPANKTVLPALRRAWKQPESVSAETILRNGSDGVIEWTDEFQRVCSFSIFEKDNSFAFSPWDVSFKLLFGQKGEPSNKTTVMGKVSLNIAELVTEMEEPPVVERTLPLALQVDGGVASKATLTISVSFAEMRSETPEIVREASFPSGKEDGFFRKVRDLTAGYPWERKKKAKKTKLVAKEEEEVSINGFFGDTDESTTFDSEGSRDDGSSPSSTQQECSSSSSSIDTDASWSPSLEINRSDSASKGGFWRKRRFGFRSSKKIKSEPSINKNNGASTEKTGEELEGKMQLESGSNAEEISVEKVWEEKDLISRDEDSKLQAEVFFASIDQRSDKAAGESACTALVAVIANWIRSNKGIMPTSSEFDGLIVEGSLEWQKLCKNETYIQQFPDKHFDLETVLAANLRPLSVKSNKSFVGFFSPERFESLKGTMSFDEIWDEISKLNMEEGGEEIIYIVSWNDHFFLLKMENDAYYIIDSLGERLFEGCKQAYILKFSDKSKIYKLGEKQDDDGNEEKMREKCDEEVVFSGKEECCREYFKRFLAAILLKELEIEEKKSTVPYMLLHQRLQIEFHFCSSPSSSSSSDSNFSSLDSDCS